MGYRSHSLNAFGQRSLPLERMTHRRKNITFQQPLDAEGNNIKNGPKPVQIVIRLLSNPNTLYRDPFQAINLYIAPYLSFTHPGPQHVYWQACELYMSWTVCTVIHTARTPACLLRRLWIVHVVDCAHSRLHTQDPSTFTNKLVHGTC